MSRLFALLPVAALSVSLLAQAPPLAKTPPIVAAKKGTAPAPRKSGEFVIHMAGAPDKLLSAYRGKVVIMAFMYTTCPHCKHMAGVLSEVQTQYAAKGVQVLGVTFDTGAPQGVAGFIKETGTNFPCGFSTEPQVTKFLNVTGDYYVPMLMFIDRTGTVRDQIVSDGDPNGSAEKFLQAPEKAVRAELDKLLRAPAPAKAAPKA